MGTESHGIDSRRKSNGASGDGLTMPETTRMLKGGTKLDRSREGREVSQANACGACDAGLQRWMGSQSTVVFVPRSLG